MRKIVGMLTALIIFFTTPITADARLLTIEEKEHRAVESMREVWNFEEGCLTEGATIEKLDRAVNRANLLPEENEHRQNLEIMAEAAETELTKPKMHLYGSNCRITFYCPGPCCCGVYASGYTASGTRATANRTVACGDLPFGTKIMIDGQEYIVEDRGVGAQQIDIFVNSHAEADARGLYYREVWIID